MMYTLLVQVVSVIQDYHKYKDAWSEGKNFASASEDTGKDQHLHTSGLYSRTWIFIWKSKVLQKMEVNLVG